MGTIDRITYTLKCPRCGAEEKISASDKGSMWSGSHWNELPAPKLFDGILTGGERETPKIADPQCKTCKVSAEIKSHFSL